MQDPENDFDSVQWQRRDENEDEDTSDKPSHSTSSASQPPKSSAKRRDDDGPESHGITAGQDRNADATDLAGIGSEGYLHCTVDKPLKENDGTKDAYVSYLVSTRVCLPRCRSR